uniref:endo-1,4-beta-xylanase n=1 Tax=uncultured microorganism TaxID=358574 RepID=A0A7U1BNA4_9ZZZZ|nr:1,4-beta-xylanase [uncultured microorganism]
MDTTHIASLRSLAKKRDVLIGAAANWRALRTDYAYREVLAQEFDLLTTENELKFGPLSPRPNAYDFGPAEELVDFAQANDMKIRGHTLLWHKMNPDWLTENNFTRHQALELLHKHIFTVMAYFRGEVYAWDVVNEPIHDNGGLRDSFWLHTIGPDYIEYAFRWANQADPNARLFINDYGTEDLGTKSDSLYNLVKDLLRRGTPINGVGLQMHLSIADSQDFVKPPTVQDLEENLRRFADLGLEIHITEMDVQIQNLSGSMEEQLERQARVYEDVLTVALRNPQLKAFVLWGFTDRYSWIPKATGRPDAPLPFDEYYQPKPAYEALYRALQAA